MIRLVMCSAAARPRVRVFGAEMKIKRCVAMSAMSNNKSVEKGGAAGEGQALLRRGGARAQRLT